jgi:prepilin-type N-terminal cleavage/methylation domain-containing protein
MMQRGKRHNSAFTLIELIVVIIIIAIIAGFSAMSYSKIAKGMRMSSAKNTLITSLDNTRALAIRNNRYVMTVFRPRLSSDGTEQFYEAVIAEWNGDSSNSGDWTYDRFVPIPNLKPIHLPVGVGVAGPGIALNLDHIWWVSTYLPANAVIKDSSFMGEMVGVLYNPEGRVVVRNAKSGSDRMWVDFDRDQIQMIDPDPDRNGDSDDEISVDWTEYVADLPSGVYFDVESPSSETFIGLVDLLAVFDYDAFRDLWGASHISYPIFPDIAKYPWERNPDGGTIDKYDRDWHFTDFINRTSDRIQFNRYSGVPQK